MEVGYLSDNDHHLVEKLLPNNSQGDCEQNLSQKQEPANRQNTIWCLRKTADIVIYALALWGFFSIILQVVHKVPGIIVREQNSDVTIYPGSPTRRSCACGNSTAEAIALGCVFDLIAPAWMQPYCVDEELSAEFNTLGDGPNGTWIYYADRRQTKEISMTEMMSMADDPDARFHVSWKWHVTHCWMYWVKLFRAQSSEIVVEARYNTEDHIRHCVEVFGNPVFGTASGVVLNADIDGP